MSGVSLGIPGAGEVAPGTHLCALYSGPDERDELLFPFLEEGIRHGDKCLCLIDDVEVASVHDRAVADLGAEPGTPDQLQVDRATEVYVRSGSFSVENMLSFLSDTVADAAAASFPLVRAAGEMSWVLPRPRGAEDFFTYESAINRSVGDMPAVFMCMYDVNRFGVGMLIDVLRTHPKVLLDRTVLDNPQYVTPDEYAGHSARTERHRAGPPTGRALVPRPRDADRATDRWSTLTDAEVRVAELVADGLTNRSVAELLVVSPHTVDAHLKHIFAKLDIHSRVELTVLSLRHRD